MLKIFCRLVWLVFLVYFYESIIAFFEQRSTAYNFVISRWFLRDNSNVSLKISHLSTWNTIKNNTVIIVFLKIITISLWYFYCWLWLNCKAQRLLFFAIRVKYGNLIKKMQIFERNIWSIFRIRQVSTSFWHKKETNWWKLCGDYYRSALAIKNEINNFFILLLLLFCRKICQI